MPLKKSNSRINIFEAILEGKVLESSNLNNEYNQRNENCYLNFVVPFTQVNGNFVYYRQIYLMVLGQADHNCT